MEPIQNPITPDFIEAKNKMRKNMRKSSGITNTALVARDFFRKFIPAKTHSLRQTNDDVLVAKITLVLGKLRFADYENLNGSIHIIRDGWKNILAMQRRLLWPWSKSIV